MADAATAALPLDAFASAFRAWLDERASAHARHRRVLEDVDARVAQARALQRELFDAGWARCGWSPACGGLGGDILHRAVVIDLLEEAGYPPRFVFEHLEVLIPAFERFASPALRERLAAPTLRGDLLWCQGFSEPTAGSDLAALRTRAARDARGDYVVDGHKIWTSWAKWASHVLLLARTGAPEDRHRGLSAFAIPLDEPGIDVRPIEHPNGSPELAEVFFDGVRVGAEQRIGAEGDGWAVAMHILAGERGSYAWIRSCEILPRLEALAARPGARGREADLGDALARLVALRCRSRAVMETLARGEQPGPEASVSKVAVIDAEQRFYDVAREVLSPGLDLGEIDEAARWQEQYEYSRAASVYGGARPIQLNVIAKLLVSRGGFVDPRANDDELAAVRASVSDALEKAGDARAALDGLDWWAFAARPQDALGAAAFAAWFEREGAAGVASPALAGVRASAYADALGADAADLAFAVASDGAPDAVAALGWDARTRHLVVPGAGSARVFDARECAPLAPAAFDAALVARVSVAGARARGVEVDAGADARALALARIGAAHAMLGAAKELLSLAIAHANERQQFGQPLASFQAVQHLLSESYVDVSGTDELCRSAIEQWTAGDDAQLAAIAKAFAGRAGLAVAQRALQCFGAIGFTREHAHPRLARRIHVLDAVLGSRFALEAELGAAIARSGRAPRGIRAWRALA